MTASAAAHPPEIAALDSRGRRQAVALLARAFRDNPLNEAVIGGGPARRLRSNRHGMRSLIPLAMDHGRVLAARVGHGLAGVLIATPPGAYPLPSPPLTAQIRCLIGQGPRVASRWARVFEVLSAHHPVERGWYLGTLGVDPAHQGRGVGSALLAAWLGEVDRDGRAACLETDVCANVRFYERAGFEVAEELLLLDVPIWRMRRPGLGDEISTRSDPQ